MFVHLKRPVFNSTRNEEIEFYHNAGLSNEKFRLLVWLRHHANSKQDRDKASRFICQHNRTYNTEKTVLTTHPRGVCNEYDHNTLIFDEDPISHVLSIKSTTLNQLNKLLLLDVEENYLNFFDELYSQCSWMDEKSIKKIPDCKLELSDIEEELIESKVSFDVVGFINADYVYKNEGELHYISRKELPQDKKIAIMSATCSPMIYKKLYGERVKVVDLSNIEITGNIIQHTKKSYSKTSLEGSIEEANDKLTGDAAITFKGKKEDISKADDLMHFGNLRGHDYLKGFNLDVIGTPHKTNALYLLRAKAIGIDFDETEVNFEYNLVRYNGFEFKFNSFNHPELTQLQLQCIEADLIQAVGRARLLREDSTVNVYSNLPLNQAEFRYN